MTIAVALGCNRMWTFVYENYNIGIKAYPYNIGSETIVDAIQKTCFTFSYEVDALVSRGIIRDKSGVNGSRSHLRLLGTTPSIWMTKNKFDVIFDQRPQSWSIGLAFCNISFGTVEKVLEEVAEDVNDGLARRQWYQIGGAKSIRR